MVQSPKRVSVDDYYRMAATGELSPDARVELLDGRILDMAPIGSFHGGMTNYLTEIFAIANRRRWVMAVQNPVRLNDFSEPQPDLMLLHPAADYYQRGVGRGGEGSDAEDYGAEPVLEGHL